MDSELHSKAREYEANYIRRTAQERLQHSINILQGTMYEMELYLERLEQAQTDAERADLLNWAINHLVSNIMPNVRIDLLAHSQAELIGLSMPSA